MHMHLHTRAHTQCYVHKTTWALRLGQLETTETDDTEVKVCHEDFRRAVLLQESVW